jgi:hypothetical protein
VPARVSDISFNFSENGKMRNGGWKVILPLYTYIRVKTTDVKKNSEIRDRFDSKHKKMQISAANICENIGVIDVKSDIDVK